MLHGPKTGNRREKLPHSLSGGRKGQPASQGGREQVHNICSLIQCCHQKEGHESATRARVAA